MRVAEQRMRSWHRSPRAKLGWLALAMAATVVVTFLAIFRVDVSHGLSVSFRHAEKYQATEVLMLEHPEPPGVTPTNIPSPIATTLFAQLANSSVVRSLVLKTGPLHGSYTASSAPEPSYPAGTAVPPILSIVSEAGNSNQATLIAELVSNAFVAYMHNAWLNSTGPPSQEIEVRKISLPTHPKLIQGRSLTFPLVIFSILITLLGISTIRTVRTPGP